MPIALCRTVGSEQPSSESGCSIPYSCSGRVLPCVCAGDVGDVYDAVWKADAREGQGIDTGMNTHHPSFQYLYSASLLSPGFPSPAPCLRKSSRISHMSTATYATKHCSRYRTAGDRCGQTKYLPETGEFTAAMSRSRQNCDDKVRKAYPRHRGAECYEVDWDGNGMKGITNAAKWASGSLISAWVQES